MVSDGGDAYRRINLSSSFVFFVINVEWFNAYLRYYIERDILISVVNLLTVPFCV